MPSRTDTDLGLMADSRNRVATEDYELQRLLSLSVRSPTPVNIQKLRDQWDVCIVCMQHHLNLLDDHAKNIVFRLDDEE